MIDLRDKDKAILSQLAQQCFSSKTEIWAYGSRIKGTNHDASDLDLVVHFGPNGVSDSENFKQLSSFKEALQESTIPIFVQIFAWTQIPEAFKANIKAEYQILHIVI
jgi:predicted nucleotidyltransferase